MEPLYIILTIAAVLLVIVFILKRFKKPVYVSWRGTLVDKKFIERHNEQTHQTENYYSFIIKTKEGKLVRSGASKELFDSFTVGDQLEKLPQDIYPRKV